MVDAQWFQPRPSAATDPNNKNDPGYNPLFSGASNVGPTNPILIKSIQARRAAVAAFDGVPDQYSVFFSPGEEKAAYLAGEPSSDSRFVGSFAHVLEHAGGYSPDDAKRVAETLLPDVLSYDPTEPAGYPDSGRTLTDDVAAHFLTLFTNGKVSQHLTIEPNV